MGTGMQPFGFHATNVPEMAKTKLQSKSAIPANLCGTLAACRSSPNPDSSPQDLYSCHWHLYSVYLILMRNREAMEFSCHTAILMAEPESSPGYRKSDTPGTLSHALSQRAQDFRGNNEKSVDLKLVIPRSPENETCNMSPPFHMGSWGTQRLRH